MKERDSKMKWFPFWTDKWIFGSMRIECTIIERAIWIDLLALASKDNGFIRANEDTPYLITQLAGMLVIKEDQLRNSINKFIRIGKLGKEKSGVLYIVKWNKYQLSERHKRRIKKDIINEMAGNEDMPAAKKDAYKKEDINNKDINNKDIKHTPEKPSPKKTELEKEFEEFWKGYKAMGNSKNKVGNKQEAYKAFKTLRKKIGKDELIKALWGEADYLKYERLVNNFDKRKKYASTWLRSDKWKEHKDFKYTARL